MDASNHVHSFFNFNGRLRLKTRWIILCALAAVAVFYFIFDPLESRFMPQCVFYKITGLKCIGCGSQRMAHSLLHGDFVGAFKSNVLAFISLPFILFLIWVEMQRKKRPRLYAKVYSTPLIIVVGVVMALWFILRNLLDI